MPERLPNPERAWRPRHRPGTDPKTLAEARVGPSFDSVRLLGGGHANLNLRLDRDRVLRIYVRDAEAGQKERRVMEAGWEGFQVPTVLDEGPDFLLLEWLELTPLLDTPGHGRRVGLAAAEIHAVRFGRAGVLNADLDVVAPLPAVRGYLREAGETLGEAWIPWLEEARALLEAEEARTDRTAGALCHGDFKAANLFVGPEGGLVVLDWEFAFSGPPLFDLGQLFRWGASPGFQKGFVAGYRENGGTLPEGWRERAEVLDLVNLVGLATRTRGDPVRAADLQRRMERTLTAALDC